MTSDSENSPTITIAQALSPGQVYFHTHISSKKKLFEQISMSFGHLSETNAEHIYDKLVAREKLGTTSLGRGIAIPHCRLEEASSLQGAFFLLQEGVDFDSLDKEKVDIVFGLLIPDGDNEPYLKFIAKLAELFRDNSLVNQIRASDSSDSLFSLLTRL